jgi:hypothetical protein
MDGENFKYELLPLQKKKGERRRRRRRKTRRSRHKYLSWHDTSKGDKYLCFCNRVV